MGPRNLWPYLAIANAIVAIAAAVFAFWALNRVAAPTPSALEPPPPPPPREDRRVLTPARFDELPGWREDALADALPPLLAACRALLAKAPGTALEPGDLGRTVDAFRPPCAQARRLPPGDHEAARAFFEAAFAAFAVSNHEQATGLFTGYYEPTLAGSRTRSERFKVPLLRRPRELVAVDLGRFREEWKGQRLAGKVEDGVLVPFADRAAIDAGALAGRGLELAWVEDPVEAFFLHVQGSGRVELAEGGTLRVGYAAQNGHPYVAIGRELVARGEMTLAEVSLQSIRAWLAAHPEDVPALLAKNPSYVFFRELQEPGVVGSLGTMLTPERSLAIDRRYLPLGAPLFLATTTPAPDPATPDLPWNRLMIAEDTGGAIRGPVRGDVFWGPGEAAEERAGRMKHPGKLWLLLPR